MEGACSPPSRRTRSRAGADDGDTAPCARRKRFRRRRHAAALEESTLTVTTRSASHFLRALSFQNSSSASFESSFTSGKDEGSSPKKAASTTLLHELLDGVGCRDDKDDGGQQTAKGDKTTARAGERVKREVWELFYGPTASVGDCPVCGSPVTWKRWQAGHMRAAAHGGDTTAANIVVSCGCNQEASVTHVLDYMGAHAAHRVTRLMDLVIKLFVSRVPKPARRKLIAVHGEHVLVEFVRRYYNPPKLDTYQCWIEADADDLQRLSQPADLVIPSVAVA